MNRLCYFATAMVLLAGCSRQGGEQVETFEPNLVHAMKYQMKEGIPMNQAARDASWIVGQMFGTPDNPKLPELFQDEDFAGLISMERLQQAAGPPGPDSGLYRQHCASCHGVTGNGRGVNSALLDPYPRDYRAGIFKFKSTERGAKPVREDLARTIRHGIAGTTMVPYSELAKQSIGTGELPDKSADVAAPAEMSDEEAAKLEEQIQALVDYVIYLSIRGEVERTLIDDAVFELDLAGGDRVINREFGESLAGGGREEVEQQIAAWEEAGEPEDTPGEALADKLELFDESMEIAEDLTADIADQWLEAEDEVVEVPEPPNDIPVTESHDDFIAKSQGDQAEALAKSVARGKEVFLGKVASCSKCHGEKGHGDGQTNDYDDWTKDWTERAGLKPENTEALIPLMARGALPPKNAKPRNFADGIFRGGESSEDLYRRISQGIEGSPMPASTFVEGEYDKDDIWNLINFVRSVEANAPGA